MRESKSIDRLFQEKFKDFEASPNEAMWKTISAKLQEKEQRKPMIAPIWSRLAGMAAVLAIFFMIGDWFLPSGSQPVIAWEELEEDISEGETLAEQSLSQRENGSARPALDQKARNQAQEHPLNSGQPDVKPLSSLSQGGGIASQVFAFPAPEIVEKKRTSSIFSKNLLLTEMEAHQQEKTSPSEGNFEIATHAAPVYYGNFGKGNFLDPQFNNNESQGEVTYSYGVQIAYTISRNLKIRSGVNKVNMSYSTNGIDYRALTGPFAISSIAYSPTGSIRMSGSQPKGWNKKGVISNSSRASVGSVPSGLLNQEMGFIEIPVELEYNIIQKKFELNLIGGASTLFLSNNHISMNTGNFWASGKATNINNISFSTNIGLGLDYNFSDKFELNFEPILKYQLNTFSTSPSNTQPFYLGVYSGFSYKF